MAQPLYETAEEQRHDDRVAVIDLAHIETAAQRHGKRVHGQADGDE